MKKNFLFILFAWLITAGMVSAANKPSKLEEANAKYKAEDYTAAATLYEEILKENESASAYYNLGNAYYKQKQLGRAILNYERALLRDPDNEDILYNLGMAKSQTIDKIEPVDHFFITIWIKNISTMWSTNAWAYASIAGFIIVLGLGALFVFSRIGWMKKSAFFAAILFLLCSMVSFYFSKVQKEALTAHNYGIIISATVIIKSSPDESGKDLFLLHEGTKVKIKQALSKWDEIQLENGSTGWITSADLEKI